MRQKVPKFVEVTNNSDKPQTLRDPGLFEAGGQVTIQPGEVKSLPAKVYFRNWRKLWLERAGLVEESVPEVEPLTEEQQGEIERGMIVEEEKPAPKSGAKRRRKADA